MKISVVMPTYNRQKRLEQCLKALQAQTLSRDAFEVVVVVDGSTDSTQAWLETFKPETSLNLQVITQENKGAGEARNRGIAEANGEVIVFIGDDIVCTPNFLETHQAFHAEHPEEGWAALGITPWLESETVTPFMQWLIHGGPQFAFDKLTSNQAVDFRFFYTSNISLKRSLLLNDHFDSDFKGYGWEDIELGYRLQKKGLQLIYHPQALAFHDDPMDETMVGQRMEQAGKNARLFESKHPELKVLPHGIKKWIWNFLTAPFILKFLKALKNSSSLAQKLYWRISLKQRFLKGAFAV